LYTTGVDSQPRRSAQTAMYQIAEGMARWLAPVLSFTAEEIWQELPGEHEPSVFLALFEECASQGATEIDWDALIDVRETVAKALEALRDEGTIGSALEATVTVYADDKLRASLDQLGDELRFVFITSEAATGALADAPADAVQGEGFQVVVGVSDHGNVCVAGTAARMSVLLPNIRKFAAAARPI